METFHVISTTILILVLRVDYMEEVGSQYLLLKMIITPLEKSRERGRKEDWCYNQIEGEKRL